MLLVSLNIKGMQASRLSGFTIIEVIVALGVISLFVAFFFQIYLTTESQRIGVMRRVTASDIAYTNLRKFSAKPGSLSCTSDMDLTVNANAPGTVISTAAYAFTPETVSSTLGSNATQTVLAFAPSGCAAYGTNPVKIVSKVGYGTDGEEVVHASFVN